MMEPKQIGFSTVDELIFMDDGAGATMIPALFFPTDGANCRRVTSADPRFEYPRLIERKRGECW